jgi:hypothetical protein
MKPPDDTTSRKARLRRELVDAFVNGDDETWLEATRELTRILRAEGVPTPQKGRPRRADFICAVNISTEKRK